MFEAFASHGDTLGLRRSTLTRPNASRSHSAAGTANTTPRVAARLDHSILSEKAYSWCMRVIHALQVGVGVCAGLLLAGVTTASASKLGTATGQTLASGATVVASCDTSIAASWNDGSTSPVWVGNATAANSTFNVTTLKLTGIAAGCNGQRYKAVVADSTGTAIESWTGGTISGTTLTLTLSPAASSTTIEQIIIVIYG